MEKKRLNNSDLSVSPLCLGTGRFGTAIDELSAKEQLSLFYDRGGNFIDTAHVYGNWVSGKESASEKVIGRWLKESGHRDKIILTTKGAHPDLEYMGIARLQRDEIKRDMEESLRFLQTDYIDLYLLHRDDPQVPVEEIIDHLDNCVEQGIIRYYGCSNWRLPRIIEAAKYARKKDSKGFVVNQLMYSLPDINLKGLPDESFIPMDKQTLEYHKEQGMNAMAYMSLAKGFLLRLATEGSRPSIVEKIYDNRINEQIFEMGNKIVERGVYSFIDLSLMFLMSEKEFPLIPIASFSNSGQLHEAINSINKSIPEHLFEDFSKLKQFIH